MSCLVLGLVGACGFNSSGTPNSGSGLGGTTEDVGSSATPADTEESASRTSGKTGQEDSDSAEVGPSATSDPPRTTTNDGTTGGDPPRTDSGPPSEEPLQNAPQTACNEPFWCFDPTVWDPAGGPIWAYECFTSSLDPPLTLLEVNFIVPLVPPELEAVHLHLTEWGGDLPGEVVFVENNVALAQGANTIVPSSPAVVDTRTFCVGLHAPSLGLAGALGVAVDTTSTQHGISFVRGTGACEQPLDDIFDLTDPTPAGNWCIDVRVQGG